MPLLHWHPSACSELSCRPAFLQTSPSLLDFEKLHPIDGHENHVTKGTAVNAKIRHGRECSVPLQHQCNNITKVTSFSRPCDARMDLFLTLTRTIPLCPSFAYLCYEMQLGPGLGHGVVHSTNHLTRNESLSTNSVYTACVLDKRETTSMT